jgi:hypothetical protein
MIAAAVGNEIIKIVLLSLACGAMSMTLSKAKISAPFRAWVKKRNPWIGEGLSCPYCTSHWIALILTCIYFPRPVFSGLWFPDFFVSLMILVAMSALSSVTTRLIFLAYSL